MMMNNYAGKRIMEGYFFMSSYKSEEMVQKKIEETQLLCLKNGVLLTAVGIEHNPPSHKDIDRESIRQLMKDMESGQYDVLVLRSLCDICSDEADWENFINLLGEYGVFIYSIEQGVIVFNNYEEGC